jgi:DNA-binding GntR family transcriptional regulator
MIKFRQNRFQHEMKHYDLRSINSFILFGIRKNSLSSVKSLVLRHLTRVIKLTAIIIKAHHCYQLHAEFYPTSFSQGYVHTYIKLLEIISVDTDITDKPLITFFCIHQILEEKKGSTMRQLIS